MKDCVTVKWTSGCKAVRRWSVLCFLFGTFMAPVMVHAEMKISEKQAQPPQQTVSGVIVDDKNVPIPGVNVVEKGTTNGTTSDFDGLFEIQVGQGATLEISSIGFVKGEIRVTDTMATFAALKSLASYTETGCLPKKEKVLIWNPQV